MSDGPMHHFHYGGPGMSRIWWGRPCHRLQSDEVVPWQPYCSSDFVTYCPSDLVTESCNCSRDEIEGRP